MLSTIITRTKLLSNSVWPHLHAYLQNIRKHRSEQLRRQRERLACRPKRHNARQQAILRPSLHARTEACWIVFDAINYDLSTANVVVVERYIHRLVIPPFPAGHAEATLPRLYLEENGILITGDWRVYRGLGVCWSGFEFGISGNSRILPR